jgi:hypothetical protein
VFVVTLFPFELRFFMAVPPPRHINPTLNQTANAQMVIG